MFSAARVKHHSENAFCMICGLEEGRDRWLRAIYRTPDGVEVTEPTTTAWYHCLKSESGFTQLRHGTDVYPFHERCWHRLLESFDPNELHLASLFEAFERLPLPRDYEFPAYASLPGRLDSCPWPGAKEDQHEFPILPGRFPLPGMEELMRFAKEPPRSLPTNARRRNEQRTDSFNRLSVEVIVRIASLLPTKDALSLRHVTRAAMPLFENSKFWRSRFVINGERGFLLPVVQQFTTPERNHEIDWRLLYHCTVHLNCSDWFEIEVRAWETLRWLRDTASAIRCGRPRPPDFRGSPSLQHYHNTTRRNTFIESIDVSPSLCKIAISALQESGEVNITGLEFIFNDGTPSAMLGYATPGAREIKRKEYTERRSFDWHTSWPCPGVRVTIKVTSLRGILFTQDANGIHGISIFHNGEDFDNIQDPLCVGIPNCDFDSMLIAYSVSLDKVDKVFAVSDNRKMINLGISGSATRRWQYDEDEWEEVVDMYRNRSTMSGLLRSM